MRSQGEKSITSVESYPETAGIEYAGDMGSGLVGIDVGPGPSLLGLLGFVVLLLLPGLLVVRAPWPAVPFLSLAFWALTWGWLFGASREPFLRGALLSFFLLALLRLFKPLGVRRPGWPTVLVLAGAALPLLVFFRWPVCPGAEMSFHSLGARLLVWRDGLPSTYEPLAPVRPFGAHAPALPTLAADVSLLSGLPPAKSVLLVHQAALGLLLIGLYALLARWLAAPEAALAAVLAVALARVPTAFAAFGDGGPLLALAFATAAAAWLGPAGHRSSAVAAGTFLGASALAQPALALCAALALGLRLRPWKGGPARIRLGLATGVALVLAAPLLWRLASALSSGEAAALASAVAPTVPAAAAVAVAAIVPVLIRRCWPPRRPLAALGLAVLMACAAWSAREDWLVRAGAPRPGRPDYAAIARVAARTRPLDAICIDPADGAGLWIPALAGRAVHPPWVPLVYRDEARASLSRAATAPAGLALPCVHEFTKGTEVPEPP
jgi:hypothetical protein